MGSPQDLVVDPEAASASTNTANHTRTERWICAAICVLLGSVLVYAAGFAADVGLHNAAHDARHAAGFPCN
jgi:cobalt transporter subunit CbtB